MGTDTIITVRTDMTTGTEGGLALVRLLQLASPSLPVGAFSYSQGLETAVELGWVDGVDAFADWLASLVDDSLVPLELALLARLHRAASGGDADAFDRWTAFLLASRETRELREEESSRGRAMRQVLDAVGIDIDPAFAAVIARSQLAGLAYAGARWHLPTDELVLAHAFAWLENAVMAGIKLVPLGQSAGQALLARFGGAMPARVARATCLADAELGASSPAMAIASSLHETQYTRLFRS